MSDHSPVLSKASTRPRCCFIPPRPPIWPPAPPPKGHQMKECPVGWNEGSQTRGFNQQEFALPQC